MTLGLNDLAFVGSLTPLPRWDAIADLAASLVAGATNPNGQWRYGEKDANLMFSLVTNLNASGWFGNRAFNTPLFFAGAGVIDSHVPVSFAGASTIRWTAPVAMTVSIDLRVAKTVTAGDGVIHNVSTTGNTVINSSSVIQGPSGAHEYFNPSLVVAAGHTVDFDCSRNGNDASDNFRYERLVIARVA